MGSGRTGQVGEQRRAVPGTGLMGSDVFRVDGGRVMV